MPRAGSQNGTRLRDDWRRRRRQVTNRLLAEISNRIVRAFHPDKVVLFGSYAYGKPHVYSDIDLFVIMRSSERMARRIMKVDKVARVPRLPMDILVFTPAEVRARRARGDSFVEEVLTKGRVLYQRGRRQSVGREGRG